MKKNELINSVTNIYLKEEAKQKIIDRAKSCKNEKESIIMSKKKTGLIAIAATMVLGIAAYATSGVIVGFHSSSSHEDEYYRLPTKEECIEEIGYAPILIEEFSNDYTFESAVPTDNYMEDESGEKAESFKSMYFNYSKDGDEVSLFAEKFDTELEFQGEIAATVDDIELYYSSYMNKLVPADYKLTEDDKKAVANGELIFSYGSSSVEVFEVKSLSWEKDSIRYMLMQQGGNLSADELVSMAKDML